ncbi:MAG: phosphoenolpyruvate--protein phosphotransferase [Candidatus Theseobacter exili]|nr:phosphoenolpyruvate--protein phosphotransferase [Candidatus Theseobacter exili]
MAKEKTYRGVAVSPGVILGKVFILDSQEDTIVPHSIETSKIPYEIARFEEALIATRREILNIQKQISQKMGVDHAEIFNAHLMVLEDRSLIEEILKRLEKEKKNIEYIFQQVITKYSDVFSQIKDEYLRERASDIRDVGKRVLHNLLGKKKEDLSKLKEEVIVIAYDLSPSDTAAMHKENVIGFATDIGSRTSHTAIMARSLEIPAVVGLHDITKHVKNGDTVLVDGHRGIVILNPEKKTLGLYQEERTRIASFLVKLEKIRDLPAETKDGRRITLSANIEMPEDIPSVINHGAEGVGLYRTEFFYMGREDLPTEEEHYEAYMEVAEKVYPNDVIIRTMDLGGDKYLSHLDIPNEMNPFMGWRGIRYCLERLDVFEAQLRAILRASRLGNVKIMYPMISGVVEVIRANEILEGVKQRLDKEKTPYSKDIEVGAMIEVPSAALTARDIAKHVDFFSIGTNDLIQYSLAVDRVNEKVAYLYEPTHPGILNLIKSVIDAAHDNGIWVGMCGEMAGEPAMTMILLGMGLDEFSTSSASIPEVKHVIRSVNYEDAKALADKVTSFTTPGEIKGYAEKVLCKSVPELMEQKNKKLKHRR